MADDDSCVRDADRSLACTLPIIIHIYIYIYIYGSVVSPNILESTIDYHQYSIRYFLPFTRPEYINVDSCSAVASD